MSSYVGISPKDPNKYLGPTVFLSSIVTRNRIPTGADYRNPNNGKIYAVGSFWLISKDPISGAQGDLWYLSKVVSNVAYWVILTSGGVGPLLDIVVQAVTAPGVNPVSPTVGGLITINGAVVANHSVVLETRSRALNTFNLEVQYSTSAASTDGTKSGVSHYNSAQFSVDSQGFVSLLGGSEAIDSIGVDATSGSGTNPVLPTAAGLITVNGALVAAGTNPIRTVSTAANVYQIQAQTSQALAATDATKVGLSNFSNLDFTVDSNGFVQSLGATPQPGVRNLGFTYNAGTGTFTVHGQDGTALSAANPGFVTMQSKTTPANLVTYTITANQDFIDDNGASQIINNLFGLTAGTANATDVPFFLYAVGDDTQTTIAFMISRFPNSPISPINTKIGTPSSSIADTQGSFFAFDSITVTNYDSNPCLSIGSFRMRMSAANDWTVQTLLQQDGIGHFQQGVQFSMPVGQFSNAAGAYFLNNGGTAPVFTNQNLAYYIFMSNEFSYWFAGNACSSAGLGAVQLRQGLPYVCIDIGTQGSGIFIFAGAYSILLPNSLAASSNQIFTVYANASATGSFNNADIILGVDVLFNGRMALLFS